MPDDLDEGTRAQLDLDRAEAAYEAQCWREDMAELHGWNDTPHPTLQEFLERDRKNRRAD